DAWERSKGAAGGSGVATTSAEGQGGDVKYIAESRAALADVRKTWGADAPLKHSGTTPDGKQPAGPGLIEEMAPLLRQLRRRAPEDDAAPAAGAPPAPGGWAGRCRAAGGEPGGGLPGGRGRPRGALGRAQASRPRVRFLGQLRTTGAWCCGNPSIRAAPGRWAVKRPV